MKSRGYTYRVVVLSLFFAYLFAIVPLPEWSLNWRPEWVLLFVFYWTMALPYRIGLGFAWLAGLLLDVLEGGMLGLNALTLMLVAYIALSLHQRLRMYTPIQQSGVVLIVSLLALLLAHWLQVVTGQIVATDSAYLFAALSSAAIWPVLFSLLRSLRRGFINS